jgi:hypothetical protein
MGWEQTGRRLSGCCRVPPAARDYVQSSVDLDDQTAAAPINGAPRSPRRRRYTTPVDSTRANVRACESEPYEIAGVRPHPVLSILGQLRSGPAQ